MDVVNKVKTHHAAPNNPKQATPEKKTFEKIDKMVIYNTVGSFPIGQLYDINADTKNQTIVKRDDFTAAFRVPSEGNKCTELPLQFDSIYFYPVGEELNIYSVKKNKNDSIQNVRFISTANSNSDTFIVQNFNITNDKDVLINDVENADAARIKQILLSNL